MAKKKNESLTERISALINRVGEQPAPGMDVIKSSLVPCLGMAKSLEKGTGGRDAEAKVEILKSENADLKSELQALTAELDAFRVEQKKQAEADKDLPDKQFEILQRLPLVNENGSNLDVISRGAGIPKDEAEIHLDKLCKAKPALAYRTSSWPDRNETGWRRTMAGNRYVVAKRFAGDAKEEKRYKHPDLPKPEDSILDVLAIPGAGFRTKAISSGLAVFFDTKISEAKTAYLLKEMKKRGFADFREHAADGEPIWSLGEQGTEYLAERDRL